MVGDAAAKQTVQVTKNKTALIVREGLYGEMTIVDINCGAMRGFGAEETYLWQLVNAPLIFDRRFKQL